MSNSPLGRMQRVSLRDVWGDEAQHFTPWLAENIGLLSAALEIEIELLERESDVGGYSLDLHARELGSNREVIIENQLEKTDHDHLGKLLTYAAGKDAGVVVWIAAQFTEPHRQTIDWLNEISGPEVAFFGIEIELWRIDDSNPAPQFDIVARPNEWQKSMRHESAQPPSERMQTYHDFFLELLRRVKAIEPSASNATRAYPQNWFTFPLGRSGFTVMPSFFWDTETDFYGLLRVSLNIDTVDKERNDRAFKILIAQQAEIETELGSQLVWDHRDDRRSANVHLIYPDARDIIEVSPDERSTMLDWATETVLNFRRIFVPRVQNL